MLTTNVGHHLPLLAGYTSEPVESFSVQNCMYKFWKLFHLFPMAEGTWCTSWRAFPRLSSSTPESKHSGSECKTAFTKFCCFEEVSSQFLYQKERLIMFYQGFFLYCLLALSLSHEIVGRSDIMPIFVRNNRRRMDRRTHIRDYQRLKEDPETTNRVLFGNVEDPQDFFSSFGPELTRNLKRKYGPSKMIAVGTHNLFRAYHGCVKTA